MLLKTKSKKNKNPLNIPFYREITLKYIENNDVFLFSEDICKAFPPKECSDKELDIIIKNTAHFWNLQHVMERNTRRWKRQNGMENE